MNLTNYGVQELNAQELKGVDGGWFDNIISDIGNAIGTVVGIVVRTVLVAIKIVAEKII